MIKNREAIPMAWYEILGLLLMTCMTLFQQTTPVFYHLLMNIMTILCSLHWLILKITCFYIRIQDSPVE